jgi:hypothetical protein
VEWDAITRFPSTPFGQDRIPVFDAFRQVNFFWFTPAFINVYETGTEYAFIQMAIGFA